MSRYLVTGGAGFIGSNLVERLLRTGHHVRAYDDFSTGRRANLAGVDDWAACGGGRFELVEADVRDRGAVRSAMDGVEFVLHQAAMPSVPRSVRDPVASNEVNVHGTLLLLEAARDAGVRRFVFASSSSIYGESEELPKRESMPRAPISPYGLQKMTAEMYCGLFHALYGLPTVALRYFNVFGPRQDPGSEYSAVIPKFITAVREGRSPTIHGDGEQSRDFTYVDNAVQANLKACEARAEAFGRTFNVGCGDRITLNELVARIGRLAGVDPRAEHGPPREGDIRHSLAAIDAARGLLDYDPEVDIDEGLRRTWEASA
jgi:nucleoside-diphosphate-sugar epimerase